MLAYIVRASSLGFVLVAIGCVVFPVLVRRAGIASPRAETLRTWSARTGMTVMLVFIPVALARLYFQLDSMRFPGEPLGQSFGPLLGSTLWGKAWLVQLLCASLAAFSFSRGAPARAVSAVLVVVVAVTFSASGHAAAADNYRIAAIAMDATHFLAAGAWMGSLAVLAMSWRRSESLVEFAPVVRAFSPVALTCAAVLAVTGALPALARLGTLPALFTSPYGRVLIGKLTMVSVVLACGWMNWKKNRVRMEHDAGASLRTGVLWELTAALLVVLLTAVLIVTPPPAE